MVLRCLNTRTPESRQHCSIKLPLLPAGIVHSNDPPTFRADPLNYTQCVRRNPATRNDDGDWISRNLAHEFSATWIQGKNGDPHTASISAKNRRDISTNWQFRQQIRIRLRPMATMKLLLVAAAHRW